MEAPVEADPASKELPTLPLLPDSQAKDKVERLRSETLAPSQASLLRPRLRDDGSETPHWNPTNKSQSLGANHSLYYLHFPPRERPGSDSHLPHLEKPR